MHFNSLTKTITILHCAEKRRAYCFRELFHWESKKALSHCSITLTYYCTGLISDVTLSIPLSYKYCHCLNFWQQLIFNTFLKCMVQTDINILEHSLSLSLSIYIYIYIHVYIYILYIYIYIAQFSAPPSFCKWQNFALNFRHFCTIMLRVYLKRAICMPH